MKHHYCHNFSQCPKFVIYTVCSISASIISIGHESDNQMIKSQLLPDLPQVNIMSVASVSCIWCATHCGVQNVCTVRYRSLKGRQGPTLGKMRCDRLSGLLSAIALEPIKENLIELLAG